MENSGLKVTLCNIFREFKEDKGYTYEDIINLSKPLKINKNQIGLILKEQGYGVGCELIYKVLEKLGCTIEVKKKE